MRNPLLLLAVLLPLAGAAHAQVTIDLHALDSLPVGSGTLPSPAPYLPGPRPAPRAMVPELRRMPSPGARAKAAQANVTTGNTTAGNTTAGNAAHGGPAAPPASVLIAPAQPALPTEAPSTVALAPIAPPPPSAEPATPPPPPISATAATQAKAADGGLRVTFGGTDSDLSPASADQIKHYTGTSAGGDTTYNVLAYAAGSASDPSSARRLSLSRALTVRSALMADGVPSSHIFVRALGSASGSGPPDRVDINRMGASPASAKTP